MTYHMLYIDYIIYKKYSFAETYETVHMDNGKKQHGSHFVGTEEYSWGLVCLIYFLSYKYALNFRIWCTSDEKADLRKLKNPKR